MECCGVVGVVERKRGSGVNRGSGGVVDVARVAAYSGGRVREYMM